MGGANGESNGIGASPKSSRPVIHLTPGFLLAATALACAVAFISGLTCRIFILQPRVYGIGILDGISITRVVYKSKDIGILNVHENDEKSNDDDARGNSNTPVFPNLPPPRLHHGKVMPQTRYTGQTFPQDGKGRDAVRSSHDLHIQPPATCYASSGDTSTTSSSSSSSSTTRSDSKDTTEQQEQQCRAPTSASSNSNNNNSENSNSSSAAADSYDNDEKHLPAGQHLLVDIKNVNSAFLNSAERLAEAMVEVVSLSELTLLSYHCHALIPQGVSCVGVLLESHISFHTWPDDGVITLDLFTCGSGLLVPVVPVIERLFGVPQDGAGQYVPSDADGTTSKTYTPREEDYLEPPRMVWSHVLRGFRPEIKNGWRPLEADIGDALGMLELDYKKVITTTVTPYQQIDVVDVISPLHGSIRSYERSVRPEISTYESAHPELYRPNRMVFLDGIIQSTSRGDEAYHEALVHPAMFAHPDPKRVAIIGGGEGATLREVLKHSTVEEVKMIEIDEMMVNTSREVLPGWSDCSDLVGSTPSCFDDPRTDLKCEDALAWFIDRFSDETGIDSSDDDADDNDEEDTDEEDGTDEYSLPFDIIIMDALDPQDNIEFADALYSNNVFLDSLYEALTDDGVFVLQLGESPGGSDVAEELNEKNRHQIMSMVEDAGFQSMHIYEESHCGFGYPWSFLVACKSEACRFLWYLNEAEKSLDIQYRLLPTVSGQSPLHYFDGATMRSYQNPPKAWETVYCHRRPMPQSCAKYRGYDKNTVNYSIDDFEVRMSSLGEGAGRGVFAKLDIPAGSFIAGEESSKKLHFSHTTTELMESLYENVPEFKELGDVLRYTYGYGYQRNLLADYEYYVDSSLLTFINHGCNGTNNFGEMHLNTTDAVYSNEASIDPTKVGKPGTLRLRTTVFDPVVDRRSILFSAGNFVAKRHIEEGEELFQNYLYFVTDATLWVDEVMGLKAQCRGEVLSHTIKGVELEAEDI